jgi:Ca-activated chloride channel family protein
MRHWFAHPWMLWFLLTLPALSLLAWFSRWRRREMLLRLGRGIALDVLLGRRSRGRWRGMLLSLGLVGLILGMAGPQWGRDWEQSAAPGRDLVVVLDLSRSMLAETPSRLDRARAALRELSETVQKRGGHRLGLVVFAARARVACPLTHDFDHFRDVLAGFDADHLDPRLWPQDADVSGTRIGAALRLAVESCDSRFPEAQDILLVSDGDDPEGDDEWRTGALEARNRGFPVHTIGLGDPERGSPIPGRDGFLEINNERILTRMDPRPLRGIAQLTGGSCTLAGVSPPPLSRLFLEQIEPRGRREESPDALPLYQQRFAWFLGPSVLLFGLALFVFDRPASKKK